MKCYLITKKGCEFLAHKMTGKKGALFTATYINRFHEMEQQLYQPAQSSTSGFTVKTYNNKSVLTLRDIEMLTKVSRSMIRHFIREDCNSSLVNNIDYFFLQGKTLHSYKNQNPSECEFFPMLIIVTESGYVKICKRFNVNGMIYPFKTKINRRKESTLDKVLPRDDLYKASLIIQLIPSAVDNMEAAYMRRSAMKLLFGNDYNDMLDIARLKFSMAQELKMLSKSDKQELKVLLLNYPSYKQLRPHIQKIIIESFS